MGSSTIRRKPPVSRIITSPNMQAASQFHKMQENPLYPIVEAVGKSVQIIADDVDDLTARFLTLSVYFNSLVDYLQGQGYLVAKEGTRSFEDILTSHRNMSIFLNDVRHKLMSKTITMPQALEEVRQFNANPDNITKILGHMFGLAEWLTLNPDSLSDEALEGIAAEFGLAKVVQVADENNEQK